MKKISNTLLNLVSGIFLGLLLAVITLTLGEFIGMDLHLSESSNAYFILTLLVPLIVFVCALIVLMRFRSRRTLIITLLLAGLLYGCGRIYAHKIVKPFEVASKYHGEARSIYNVWNGKDTTQDNFKEYLGDQKRALDLLKKSAEQNFGYEVWIQKYYENEYVVRKELYELDKKSGNGEVKLSEDEISSIVESSNKKLQENLYIEPFWMRFYGVTLSDDY